MKDYVRIQMQRIPIQLENDLVSLCFKYSSSGVSEDLSFKQKSLALDPDILPSKNISLNAYFESEPSTEFFHEVFNLSNSIIYETFAEKSKDWLEEWKKGFTSFKLVNDYWVVPSWEESRIDPKFTISIDPGMAFGTGTHATTQMMANLIYKLKSKNAWMKSFLDVGTGSGILAILASKCEMKKIVGIETDPIARDVARFNIELNGTTVPVVDDRPLDEISEQFDIVGANIIDGVLLKLKPYLVRSMHSKSYLLLSGILVERENNFISSFLEGTNLVVDKRLEFDGWVSYSLKFGNT